MNVTLRPDGFEPDVYVVDGGHECNLAKLDKYIRALQAARKWLVEEQKRRKSLTPPAL